MATVGGVTHRLSWANRNAGWRYRCSCGWLDPKVRWTENNAIREGNRHVRAAMRSPAPPAMRPAVRAPRSVSLNPVPRVSGEHDPRPYVQLVRDGVDEILRSLGGEAIDWDLPRVIVLLQKLSVLRGRLGVTTVPPELHLPHERLCSALDTAVESLQRIAGSWHSNPPSGPSSELRNSLEMLSSGFSTFSKDLKKIRID